MKTLHTAEIILTMDGDRPLAGGGVLVDDNGTILEVGPRGAISGGHDRRHDHAVLMPGMLNCHVHMTDAAIREPVPGGDGLNAWVRRLLERRVDENGAKGGGGADPESEQVDGHNGTKLDGAILDVLATMARGGTVAIGEVCNTIDTLDAIERSGMRCRFIHELLAFPEERAARLIDGAGRMLSEQFPRPGIDYTIGAHAPYSVSPRLMLMIAEQDRSLGTYLYQHLAEDPAERLLYENGTGPWREYLEQVGAWEPMWEPPGVSPIAFYDRLGLLDERFVAVHLADATDDELRLLAARGVKAILSPTSNLHITGLLPRFETIVAAGITFALGTDGRGSNPHVDVVREAAVLLERWPDLAPGMLLRALTVSGAEVLQFRERGVIRPGARPGLVSVDIAAPTDDITALERAIVLDGAKRSMTM